MKKEQEFPTLAQYTLARHGNSIELIDPYELITIISNYLEEKEINEQEND